VAAGGGGVHVCAGFRVRGADTGVVGGTARLVECGADYFPVGVYIGSDAFGYRGDEHCHSFCEQGGHQGGAEFRHGDGDVVFG